MDSISEEITATLSTLSTKPGCYLMKDSSGKIIYVGKAINLRNRVRSYFHDSVADNKTRILVSHIADIEWIVVGSELEALILARSPQPMFKPELGPTHTEVDLTRQVMMVFRDGAPVLITHVSTGSQIPYCEDTDQGRNCGNAVTPEGTYKFGRRVAGWREAPLGKLYNPVYFNGGIAVHGANSVPGHPASHGCVRIPMSIAEYFPSLVNTGDVITVYRS